jgi:hypothetical protein
MLNSADNQETGKALPAIAQGTRSERVNSVVRRLFFVLRAFDSRWANSESAIDDEEIARCDHRLHRVVEDLDEHRNLHVTCTKERGLAGLNIKARFGSPLTDRRGATL